MQNYSNEIIELTGAVIGTRDKIQEMLLMKGLSDPTVNQIIEKIEVIIAMSGALARLLEKEKINPEIMRYKSEINALRSRRC